MPGEKKSEVENVARFVFPMPRWCHAAMHASTDRIYKESQVWCDRLSLPHAQSLYR